MLKKNVLILLENNIKYQVKHKLLLCYKKELVISFYINAK